MTKALNLSCLLEKLPAKETVIGMSQFLQQSSRDCMSQGKQQLHILGLEDLITNETLNLKEILNRGLNFCLAPLKLNLTDILVDFRKFERILKWREFFAQEDGTTLQVDWEPKIFHNKEKAEVPTTRPSNGLTNTFIARKPL